MDRIEVEGQPIQKRQIRAGAIRPVPATIHVMALQKIIDRSQRGIADGFGRLPDSSR